MANLKAMLLGSWLGDKLMSEATVTGEGAPGDKMQFYIPEAVERTGQELGTIARDLAAANATIVLTGHAKSIQVLRGLLKGGGKQLVKAYWAEGKRGLD